MRYHAYVGGMLDGCKLRGRLLYPQLGDERNRIRNLSKRIKCLQFLSGGLVQRSVKLVPLAQSLPQFRFELLNRPHLFKTRQSVGIRIFGR